MDTELLISSFLSLIIAVPDGNGRTAALCMLKQ